MTATLSGFYDALKRWRLQRRTEQALARLDDHMLRDIGIVRSDIAAIAARQASRLVATERAEHDRQALAHAEARERAFRQSSRFRLALENSSASNRGRRGFSNLSVADDIALGAVFRGRACPTC